MTIHLSDFVVCGEIINTRNYSVHGWLRLRDREAPIAIELTGNCDPDLAGRHIRFEARSAEPSTARIAPRDETVLPALAGHQIGATGTMTAARRGGRAETCEKETNPRLPAQRRLYLEWFSQNGHVVVELVDPIVEIIENAEPHAPAPRDTPPAADEECMATDEAIPWNDAPHGEDQDGCPDDPYGLFPDELSRYLDAQASAVDSRLEAGDTPAFIRELELMDELIERSEGELLGSIFDPPIRLPRPNALDPGQAERALKLLLARLAQYGVALHVCEHFTPVDAYRLLVEEICTTETVHPELRNTQWVQNFMTAEFCEECEAEMDREFDEYQRRRGHNLDDESASDEDVG